MNEKGPSTLALAHADLAQFAREQDIDFYSFKKDATSLTVASKSYVATLRDPATDRAYRLYNSNTLSFDAEYAIEGAERSNTLRSIIVRLGLISVRQLSEIPHMLVPLIDPSIVDACNQSPAGSLSEQREVEFVVRNHHGDKSNVSATRQIDYTLLNAGADIHKAHYPTPATEMIYRPDESADDIAFRDIFEISRQPSRERTDADHNIAMSVRHLLRYLQPGRLSLPEPDNALRSDDSAELTQ